MALSRTVGRLAARTDRNDPRIGDARTLRSTHGGRWRSRRVVAWRPTFLDERAGRLCGGRRRPACVLRPCPFRRVARLSGRTLAVLDRREFRILEHSVAPRGSAFPFGATVRFDRKKGATVRDVPLPGRPR